MIETSRETVGSALAFYERFCQRAEKHIAKHAAKAAQVGEVARVRMAREQANKEREEEAKRQRMEEAERKQKTVKYVVSSQHRDYVESFVYVNKGAARSTARMILDTEPASVEKRKAVFPQVLITPKKGRPVVLTILGIRGWEVVDVKRSGREVDIVLEVA